MPPPRRKLHELKPVNRGGKAYVYRMRKWVHLGKWDTVKDEPTAEAAAKLDRYRALWRVDPVASPTDDDDNPFLVQLWRDWRTSGTAPPGMLADIQRAERYLFGTEDAPAMHAFTRVEEFGAAELLAWQRHLCELTDPVKGGGTRLRLVRSTISQMIKPLRLCYAWGVIVGRVDQLHAAALTLVPPPAAGTVKEKKRRPGVTRAAVDAAIPHLSPPLRAAVELLWLTCARPSEILSLRAGEIIRGGTILTASAVSLDLPPGVWAVVKAEHKTDGTEFDRVIFFGPLAQAILAPMIEGLAAEEFIFRPADGKAARKELEKAKRKPGNYGTYKPRKGAEGERQPGEMYDSNVLRKAVKRACQKAKVTVWLPYSLRHSTFKRVQQQFGRDAARVYGGHKVGGATEIYAGADLATAARVALAMG